MTSVAERLISLHNEFGSIGYNKRHSLRKPTPINHNDTFLERRNAKRNFGFEQTFYPTTTSLAEEYIWDIMTGLSGNRSYDQGDLRLLFENGYHPAFLGKEEIPTNNTLTANAGYVLPRLVNKEDIKLLADADIHLTDSASDFFRNAKGKVRVTDKRSRIYRVDKDENNRTHITYLLRHSQADNCIDAFELVSFLAFVEFYKKNIAENSFIINGKLGTDLEKNLKALGFNLDSSGDSEKSIYNWAAPSFEEGRGLHLAPSQDFSLLRPWQTYNYKDVNFNFETESNLDHDNDTVLDATRTIKKNAERDGYKIPDYVIFGNDFSIPLLATLGLFKPEEVEMIFRLAPPYVKQELEEEIKKMKKGEDKDIIRHFRIHQFLNQYQGTNIDLRNFKERLVSTIDNFRHRIVNAEDTGLGCPVDIIDFGKLDGELIEQINQKDIKNLLLNLKKKNSKILSLSYPLGETIYPLVWLFNQKLGIKNVGFFGKVGSVIDESNSGIRRGRVVIPEYFIRIGESGRNIFQKIRNSIKKKDPTPVIKKADETELIITTNSVLLQTKEDILYYRQLAKFLESKLPIGKKIRILLDSESWYLQKVFRDLKKELVRLNREDDYRDPSISYYVSDNTRVDGSVDDDMTKTLAGQGAVAALVSPLSILINMFF
ncbi:MAG: hypothetical protein WC744_04240 [Patescibacteria group bacterium]|jgi:hypothetical protein